MRRTFLNLLVLNFLSFGLSNGAAWAQAESLLSLPSYRIRPKSGEKGFIRVGDRMPMIAVLEGNSQKPESVAEIKLAPIEGSSPLVEQGWMIENPTFTEGRIEFVLTPLQVGELTLSPLVLSDGSKKENFGLTQVYKLNVNPAADPKDPKAEEKPPEHYPPLGIQFPWLSALAWLLLALGIVTVLVLIVMRFIPKKAKVDRVVPPPELPKPEDLLALADLSRLDQEGLIDKEQFKKLYFGVSDILKTYLGKRYQFDATEMTSAELIEKLKTSDLSEANLMRIARLFDDLDQVKFTTLRPELGGDSGAMSLTDRAREIIKLTRKVTVGTVGSYEIR